MGQSKPLKLRMYEGVYRLNQNFEHIMEDLRWLQGLQVFPPRFLRACEGRVEQLRADANHELTRVLNMCEAGDSAHFSRLLARLQRSLTGTQRRFPPLGKRVGLKGRQRRG